MDSVLKIIAKNWHKMTKYSSLGRGCMVKNQQCEDSYIDTQSTAPDEEQSCTLLETSCC
jgi:hypothetical protein